MITLDKKDILSITSCKKQRLNEKKRVGGGERRKIFAIEEGEWEGNWEHWCLEKFTDEVNSVGHYMTENHAQLCHCGSHGYSITKFI